MNDLVLCFFKRIDSLYKCIPKADDTVCLDNNDILENSFRKIRLHEILKTNGFKPLRCCVR